MLASVSNWPSSSSSSLSVPLLWPLAGKPGMMPWRRCAAAALPNMSGASPAAAVLRLSASCSGLKNSFQADHFWSLTGLPSQTGRLLGKELDLRSMYVSKVASMLYVISSCARTNFFWASSMLIMNCATQGSASKSLWRPRMSSTPPGPIEAGAVLLQAIEDGSDRYASVERPRDAQLLDPR